MNLIIKNVRLKKIDFIYNLKEISIVNNDEYKNKDCPLFLKITYNLHDSTEGNIGLELYCDVKKAYSVIDTIYDNLFHDRIFYYHEDFKP